MSRRSKNIDRNWKGYYRVNTELNIRTVGTVEAFADILQRHGMQLPVESSMASLREPLAIGDKMIANRICIQPLEGFDSGDDGAPTDLVRRRYRRFAGSGAGLVWFESAAVSDDGKSNPHQMMLSPGKIAEFSALLEEMDRICLDKFGYRQYKVLQLTHSGRVSRRSDWTAKPVAGRRRQIDEDESESIVATDERIYRLIDEMIGHAVMAWEAGFDAVDIKACHGYFLSELLGAYEREGDFGGSFENRTKALIRTLQGIRERVGDSLGLTVRLNAYDNLPYPGGWGLREKDGILVPDPEEPVKLCRTLQDIGVSMIDISASQPQQHLFAQDVDETARPFAGAYDLLMAVRTIKSQVPGMNFVCSGLSQFRQFGPAVGSGGIRDGWFDLAGFGRQALAYPGFAETALSGQIPDPDKCCILCNNCFKLMNPGFSATGCVVRDPDPYAAFYRDKVSHRDVVSDS